MLEINIEQYCFYRSIYVLFKLKTFTMKNIDVLNRLMHTMELLENNQIHCHNLMTVSDVTIKAQINQLQAEFVNILQEIKDLHKNLRELFR